VPKVGMEPVRRKALVDAALRVIGDHGSLSVTMSEIAKQAGVSPALAHHYFGSKEQLLIETVRSLLKQLRDDTVTALKAAATPARKLSAVIRVSFQADQFAPQTIAAWLAFYAEAQRSEETRRFLVIYARRLRSNLLANLKRFARRCRRTHRRGRGCDDRRALYPAKSEIGACQHRGLDCADGGLCECAACSLLPSGRRCPKDR
jgi:TetR/AcrR family transcriptional repressor of bet genes